MHQTVLMHADVHKDAEVNDVAHRAAQLHAGLQILQLQNVGPENRRGQLVARVASGLDQLLDNVEHCRNADLAITGKLLLAVELHPRGQLLQLLRADVHELQPAAREQLLRRLVGLRVYARMIQHLRALRHAQKACRLLKCLGAELRHLLELRARGKRAIFLPVSDDVLCRRRVETRNLLQKRHGRRIHIHAYRIDAAFDHRAERAVQLLFRHIVLILPHADRLGVNLYQLCQRVLQAPGNRNRRAEVHVVLRKFLRRKLGRRVDRRARLVDNHVRNAGALPNQLDCHRLRLARGSAVADGKMAHAVSVDQLLEAVDCLLLFALGKRRIDDRRIQNLSRRVDHCDLAAVRVAGVEPHRDEALHRRLHQKRAQVQRKIANCRLVCRIGKTRAKLALHAGRKQPVEAVLRSRNQKRHRRRSGLDHMPPDQLHCLRAV